MRAGRIDATRQFKECLVPRPIEALIHSDALAHNLARARRAAPDSKVWAVVKANAYGHGIERVFDGLRAADGFALLDLDEAAAAARARLARADPVARRRASSRATSKPARA